MSQRSLRVSKGVGASGVWRVGARGWARGVGRLGGCVKKEVETGLEGLDEEVGLEG